jgi:hypothetical protein
MRITLFGHEGSILEVYIAVEGGIGEACGTASLAARVRRHSRLKSRKMSSAFVVLLAPTKQRRDSLLCV